MNPRASLSGLRRLSPLLLAATRAEEISRDVSRAQAALAPTSGLKTALLQQSRQEATHAVVFNAALACLPGKSAAPPALIGALNSFEARLRSDVAAGDLASSMFGLQCVLEGLGGIALEPPEGELAELGERFLPLRALVLQQEAGHQRLGQVWVPRLVRGQEERAASRTASAVQDYIGLAQSVIAAGLEGLEHFGGAKEHYRATTQLFLRNLQI